MTGERQDTHILDRVGQALPPHAFFGVSAVFHYLGPAFAVLLFPAVGVLGVAWFRIASAALVLAPFTRPWRTLRRASGRERVLLVGLGGTLAVMNSAFYLALDALPLALVAAIGFVGTNCVALWGVRTWRNGVALCGAVAGVVLLIDVPGLVASGSGAEADLIGLVWALVNGGFFVLYIVLGHAVARDGASGGVERLGAAMALAFVAVMPIGFVQALDALGAPLLVAAGIGVGICSSVVPYICDQLAMARLPRASFALLLALLPATAVVIGVIVLQQIPTFADLVGVALVMAGVAIHQPAKA